MCAGGGGSHYNCRVPLNTVLPKPGEGHIKTAGGDVGDRSFLFLICSSFSVCYLKRVSCLSEPTPERLVTFRNRYRGIFLKIGRHRGSTRP